MSAPRRRNPDADPPPRARPLQVLVVTPLGPGGRGGIDRMTDTLAAAHAARPVPGLRLRFAVSRGPGALALSPLHLAACLARLLALRLAGRVDLVHVNLSGGGSIARKRLVCGLARALGLPYVVQLHGSRFRQDWAAAPPRRAAAITALFERAAAVLVLGRAWEAHLRARAPRARLHVLPNATPARAPTAPPGAPPVRLLFLGRVGARKGVWELIDALARLPASPAWEAVIAGDGALSEARARLRAAGLEARVSLPGWLGPEAVERALAQAHVLVLPSHDENLPMSVIEAMAAGRAIVATPVGAVEDILLPGETGLLVPPGDTDALAAALARLVAEPDLRARLGQAARAFHARHLEIDGCLARLAAIWRAAALPRAPRPAPGPSAGAPAAGLPPLPGDTAGPAIPPANPAPDRRAPLPGPTPRASAGASGQLAPLREPPSLGPAKPVSEAMALLRDSLPTPLRGDAPPPPPQPRITAHVSRAKRFAHPVARSRPAEPRR
ncbi:glycosyltransferase family 4 protein [Oceanicella sp. SM1341]|uniref:glycosyltransferase family 4 protein n=1 Tax=Oceanicella sp. SM1341 TaxID=1548889 RepID=UPI000E4DE880|nr:glycosyltransferase family 4 protein [Oceanicella sp. SM1341]